MFIIILLAFVGALGVYVFYLGITYKKKVSFADQIGSIQGKATPPGTGTPTPVRRDRRLVRAVSA
jgi:hypothetical protein